MEDVVTISSTLDSKGFEKGCQEIKNAVDSMSNTVEKVFARIALVVQSIDWNAFAKGIKDGDMSGFAKSIEDAFEQVSKFMEAEEFLSGIDEGFGTTEKHVNNTVDVLTKAAKRVSDVVNTAVGRVTQLIKRAGGLVASFGRSIKGLTRPVNGFARDAKGSFNGLISNLKRLAPMILGVGSAYGVISKAVNAFMSQNEQLSSKMNSIWTALGNLLGPIITQIIDWITTAVSYFLAFLKLLGVTGKTASQLSKKANQSTQQLQRTLSGFDELNVLQDNQSNNNNNDTGLKDIDPSDWMKKLADLLKNKMWDDAAELLGAKINQLIDVFKENAERWGQVVGEWLQGITHFLAKLVNDIINWKGLGEGIGAFLNGVLAEVEGINFGEDLGKLLAAKFTIAIKILTGVLETWKLDRVGEIVSDMLKSFFDSINSALDQVNAEKIGQNIASFFSSIDYEGISESLRGLLSKAWDKAVEFLHSFLTNSQGTARNIGTAIRNFFTGIDWEGVKEDLKTLLKDAWDVALEFLWGVIAGDSEEEPPIIESLRKLGEEVGKCADKVGPLAEAIWGKLQPILEWVVTEGLPKFFSDLADTLQDLIDLLKGDMTLGEFVKNMNGLEKAIAAIVAVNAASVIGGVVTAIGKIKTVLDGGKTASLLKELVETLSGAGTTATTAAETAATAAESVATAGTAAGTGLEASALGLTSIGTALGGGVLAALGLVPVILLDTKISSEYAAQALEESGGTVEGLAQKMNELQETASHLDECMNDTTGYTTQLGWSMQESRYAAEAYKELLPVLAESLGLTNEQLQAQIDAAGGDITQIEALTGITAEHTAVVAENQATMEALSTAYENQREKVEVLKQLKEQGLATDAQVQEAEQMLATITAEYNALLAEQGLVLDANGQVVQDTADAVTREADAVKHGAEATSQAADEVENMTGKMEEAPPAADEVGEATESMGDDTQSGADKAENEIDDMTESFKEDAEEIREMVEETWTAIEERTEEFTDKLKEFFEEATDFINETVDDCITKLENSVEKSTTNVANIVEKTMDQVERCVDRGMTSTARICEQELQHIRWEAASWGRDVIYNFSDGMQSAWPTLIATLSATANLIASYLQFSEPEKGPLSHFHTSGPDMMNLFAEGMEKGKGKMLRTVSSIAGEISDTFSEQYLDTADFSKLANIGDRISFQMPSVAGGAFLPYSVGNDEAESTNSSQVETVSIQNDQIIDLMNRILNAIQDGKVIAVDKYKFGELVVSTLRSEARASGKSIL